MNPREIVGPRALEALGQGLDDLHAATQTPVTARRTWLETWSRCYRGYEPWAVVMEDPQGTLQGAALLARRRRGPVTDIVAMGDGPSDYARLPARSLAASEALADALADRLERLQGSWRLRLNFLPEGDAAAARLAELLPWAWVLPGDQAPKLRFQDDRRVRAHLSRNSWQRERTAWNRFARSGLHPAMERLDEPQAVLDALKEMESVRRRRDARLGRRTLIDTGAGSSFWRNVLIEHARRGEVQVFALRGGGELAAYSVCFSDGGSLRFWDGRVDPEWEPLSAGFLVNLAALRWGLGHAGVTEFDWMRGVEGYKLQMSTEVVPTENLLAYSCAAVASLLGAPPFLKARLRPLAERYPSLPRAWNAMKELPASRARTEVWRRPPVTGPREVLITDAGDAQARSAVAAVRAVAMAGFTPVVARSGRYSLAAASRFCARAVDVPPAGHPQFRGTIEAELSAGCYVTALPSSDAALLSLQAPVEHLVDKAAMADRARAAGLPTPPTEAFGSPEEALAHSRDFEFPVVVKPAARRGAAPTPAYLARTPKDIMPVGEWTGSVLIQPYVREEVHAVCGVVWEGRLVAVVHQRYLRTWPRDCGTSSAAVTIPPDIDLEDRLLQMLDGYEGIFQAQLAGPYLLDLNPRVYGSLSLAVAAGANLAGVYCRLVCGEVVPPIRGRPAVFYRWIEGDLRSLWVAVRRGEMSASSALVELRPRRGAAHSTESLTDPRPAVVRAAYALHRSGRSPPGP